MTLSRGRTRRSCALGFSPGQLGQCPLQADLEHKNYSKGNTLKVPGKGNSLFFCMNLKYLSFQC